MSSKGLQPSISLFCVPVLSAYSSEVILERHKQWGSLGNSGICSETVGFARLIWIFCMQYHLAYLGLNYLAIELAQPGKWRGFGQLLANGEHARDT